MFELLPVAPWALAFAFVVTAAAALLQGTMGFGLAVVSVPTLALADPALAPVPQLLITLPLALLMVWRERHALDFRGALWILVGRVPGALVGLGLLKVAAGRTLDAVLGLFVVLAVLMLATGIRIPRSGSTELATGVVSGTFSVVSSIGGPPLAMLYRDARGANLRSTLASIFSVGALITITTRTLGGEIELRDLQVAAWLMPALLLGLALSSRLKGKVEGPALRTGVLVISGAAALGLVVRALIA